ncbi:MAG: redox-regulated ATPase YchF [Deltaproteobacteria bacterium]|nr:MAG: redox-regulated ATPase YchF [Deltaproteobacteria bacterium]
MALQAGIVGLPNVGKSTLFNALTAAGAESANYPFCTIEPNVGVITVPDERLERLQAVIATKKVIPAVVEIVDIAGLVRGASKGEGLGNQFLGNIRATNAILHVVRCFDDDDIEHVEGSVDPLRDIETIETELLLADLDTATKRRDRFSKTAKSGDKDAKFHLAVAERLLELFDQGLPARAGEWSDEEWKSVREAQVITSKPVLYVCNVDEGSAATGNAHAEKVAAYAAERGAGCIVLSGAIEAEIAEIEDPEEQAVFLEEIGLSESGLARMAREVYALLGYQTYFTAGEKEIRAWTVKEGATAPQAAGVIHSDFERGFIKAEVYRLEDLEELGSEAGLKAAGKLRIEGKAYVVQDGDVMHFRFNV